MVVDHTAGEEELHMEAVGHTAGGEELHIEAAVHREAVEEEDIVDREVAANLFIVSSALPSTPPFSHLRPCGGGAPYP